MNARLAAPGTSRVHRAINHFKTWLRGTDHRVGAEHLQEYLEEFTFPCNVRTTPMALSNVSPALKHTNPQRHTANSPPRAPALIRT